jgi:hypothetical protein
MIKKILRRNAKPDMALDFNAKTPGNKGQSRTDQGATAKNSSRIPGQRANHSTANRLLIKA